MPLDYPIHERTLANGLRVIVSPDHTAPVVAVNLWVGVGSRHEESGRTGFAHLFEHLMFQGSQQVAKGEHFEALMAEGGRLNATTWFDRTNYFEVVPTGALDLALWLEADRHGRLLPAVNQENLDNQRDVVKEEKRQRYDNVPYGEALHEIYALVFPEGHPYHHPTIGSMADLDAARLSDVHEFYQRWYGPTNTVLTLCGDIEPDDGFARAERYFGELPASAPPDTAPVAPLPPLPAPARTDRHDEVPNDRLYLGFRLPPDVTPEFLAATLALEAIAGLSTSRLVRRMVRDEHSANSVDALAMGLVAGVSLGLLVVDVAEDTTVAEAEAQVVAELERFAEQGPTAAELEAAVAQNERSWLSTLASPEERADLLSQHALLHGDPGLVNSYLDRIAAVDARQVQAVADRWLRPEHRAVVVHHAPQEAAA